MGKHYTKDGKLSKQRFETLVFFIARQLVSASDEMLFWDPRIARHIRILHDEELKELLLRDNQLVPS